MKVQIYPFINILWSSEFLFLQSSVLGHPKRAHSMNLHHGYLYIKTLCIPRLHEVIFHTENFPWLSNPSFIQFNFFYFFICLFCQLGMRISYV